MEHCDFDIAAMHCSLIAKRNKSSNNVQDGNALDCIDPKKSRKDRWLRRHSTSMHATLTVATPYNLSRTARGHQPTIALKSDHVHNNEL
jgi:hypothetical protein